MSFCFLSSLAQGVPGVLKFREHQECASDVVNHTDGPNGHCFVVLSETSCTSIIIILVKHVFIVFFFLYCKL